MVSDTLLPGSPSFPPPPSAICRLIASLVIDLRYLTRALHTRKHTPWSLVLALLGHQFTFHRPSLVVPQDLGVLRLNPLTKSSPVIRQAPHSIISLPRNETRRVPSPSCTSLLAAFFCLTNTCHCVVTDSSPLHIRSSLLNFTFRLFGLVDNLCYLLSLAIPFVFFTTHSAHPCLSSPPRGCQLPNLLLWFSRSCSCAGPKYLVAVASLSDTCRLTNTWLPVRSDAIHSSIGPVYLVPRSAAYASTSLCTPATCSTRLPTSKTGNLTIHIARLQIGLCTRYFLSILTYTSHRAKKVFHLFGSLRCLRTLSCGTRPRPLSGFASLLGRFETTYQSAAADYESCEGLSFPFPDFNLTHPRHIRQSNQPTGHR